MRQNKITILAIVPVTLAALLLAWLFDHWEIAFWCNVCLGIFGSGLLTVMVSIINYQTERRRTLEAFWSYGHKAIKNLNRYSAGDELDTRIDTLLQMKDFDYQPFDDAYRDICFIFHNKKLHKEIAEQIYAPIQEVRIAINARGYDFSEYKKAVNGNQRVMANFVSEIDKLLIERKERCYQREDGENLTVQYTDTYKVHQLLVAFNDYYYGIMYPWKKKEQEDNAD